MIEKYLAPGENSWSDIADRVAGIMQRKKDREAIFSLMVEKKFVPNSPVLIGAGKPGGRNLMACHTIYVNDNIREILQVVVDAGLIFKSGGGIGIELSKISPEGTILHYSPGAKASGPVSFMSLYNELAEVVTEGGLRRAAMMATLSVDHPDIMKFIHAKVQDGDLKRFNISVTIPAGPDSVAPGVWDTLCQNAYVNGEPGAIFLDHINSDNLLLDEFGPIIGVNACAELPMYDWGSCCLGHVVLPNVIQSLGDYEELKKTVRWGVRFLDRVIDINHFPHPKCAVLSRDIRSIGLGVMGWADLLAANNIPFVCCDALCLADEIANVIYKTANAESWQLAKMNGGYRPGCRRNSSLTAIAPTGHVARLAGVEHSIYPPYEIGMGMTPDEHLDHIAVWQNHIDNAISYTISFPNDAPENIVDRIYRGAYERGIKVVSVYRDGSRVGQPCNINGDCE